MKVIYVDDERLAAAAFMRMAEGIAGLEITTFDSPLKALEYAGRNPVDLAFLDIEMPGINGIALAEKLHALDPNTGVVFVTAYKQYALDAFGADALGYLMKPFTRPEIEKAVQKKRRMLPEHGKKVCIKTMPNFRIFIDGAELALGKTKSAEMLAAIVAAGGRISSSELTFLIWGNTALNERTMNSFRVAFSRLRASLEAQGIGCVLRSEKHMRIIDKNAVSCDYFDLLDGVEGAAAGFHGLFLEEYEWAAAIKENLRKSLIK